MDRTRGADVDSTVLKTKGYDCLRGFVVSNCPRHFMRRLHPSSIRGFRKDPYKRLHRQDSRIFRDSWYHLSSRVSINNPGMLSNW